MGSDAPGRPAQSARIIRERVRVAGRHVDARRQRRYPSRLPAGVHRVVRRRPSRHRRHRVFKSFATVVQRIGYEPPKLGIQVRFLSVAPASAGPLRVSIVGRTRRCTASAAAPFVNECRQPDRHSRAAERSVVDRRPCRRARRPGRWTIARPRPAPPVARLRDDSSRVNGSSSHVRWSGRDAGTVVVDVEHDRLALTRASATSYPRRRSAARCRAGSPPPAATRAGRRARPSRPSDVQRAHLDRRAVRDPVVRLPPPPRSSTSTSSSASSRAAGAAREQAVVEQPDHVVDVGDRPARAARRRGSHRRASRRPRRERPDVVRDAAHHRHPRASSGPRRASCRRPNASTSAPISGRAARDRAERRADPVDVDAIHLVRESCEGPRLASHHDRARRARSPCPKRPAPKPTGKPNTVANGVLRVSITSVSSVASAMRISSASAAAIRQPAPSRRSSGSVTLISAGRRATRARVRAKRSLRSSRAVASTSARDDGPPRFAPAASSRSPRRAPLAGARRGRCSSEIHHRDELRRQRPRAARAAGLRRRRTARGRRSRRPRRSRRRSSQMRAPNVSRRRGAMRLDAAADAPAVAAITRRRAPAPSAGSRDCARCRSGSIPDSTTRACDAAATSACRRCDRTARPTGRASSRGSRRGSAPDADDWTKHASRSNSAVVSAIARASTSVSCRASRSITKRSKAKRPRAVVARGVARPRRSNARTRASSSREPNGFTR